VAPRAALRALAPGQRVGPASVAGRVVLYCIPGVNLFAIMLLPRSGWLHDVASALDVPQAEVAEGPPRAPGDRAILDGLGDRFVTIGSRDGLRWAAILFGPRDERTGEAEVRLVALSGLGQRDDGPPGPLPLEALGVHPGAVEGSTPTGGLLRDTDRPGVYVYETAEGGGPRAPRILLLGPEGGLAAAGLAPALVRQSSATARATQGGLAEELARAATERWYLADVLAALEDVGTASKQGLPDAPALDRQAAALVQARAAAFRRELALAGGAEYLARKARAEKVAAPLTRAALGAVLADLGAERARLRLAAGCLLSSADGPGLGDEARAAVAGQVGAAWSVEGDDAAAIAAAIADRTPIVPVLRAAPGAAATWRLRIAAAAPTVRAVEFDLPGEPIFVPNPVWEEWCRRRSAIAQGLAQAEKQIQENRDYIEEYGEAQLHVTPREIIYEHNGQVVGRESDVPEISYSRPTRVNEEKLRLWKQGVEAKSQLEFSRDHMGDEPAEKQIVVIARVVGQRFEGAVAWDLVLDGPAPRRWRVERSGDELGKFEWHTRGQLARDDRIPVEEAVRRLRERAIGVIADDVAKAARDAARPRLGAHVGAIPEKAKAAGVPAARVEDFASAESAWLRAWLGEPARPGDEAFVPAGWRAPR
jgi:hypothetical protein